MIKERSQGGYNRSLLEDKRVANFDDAAALGHREGPPVHTCRKTCVERRIVDVTFCDGVVDRAVRPNGEMQGDGALERGIGLGRFFVAELQLIRMAVHDAANDFRGEPSFDLYLLTANAYTAGTPSAEPAGAASVARAGASPGAVPDGAEVAETDGAGPEAAAPPAGAAEA